MLHGRHGRFRATRDMFPGELRMKRAERCGQTNTCSWRQLRPGPHPFERYIITAMPRGGQDARVKHKGSVCPGKLRGDAERLPKYHSPRRNERSHIWSRQLECSAVVHPVLGVRPGWSSLRQMSAVVWRGDRQWSKLRTPSIRSKQESIETSVYTKQVSIGAYESVPKPCMMAAQCSRRQHAQPRLESFGLDLIRFAFLEGVGQAWLTWQRGLLGSA